MPLRSGIITPFTTYVHNIIIGPQTTVSSLMDINNSMFGLTDDAWNVILGMVSNVSKFSLSLACRKTRKLTESHGFNGTITLFEIGESGSLELVRWARESGAFNECGKPFGGHKHLPNPILGKLREEGLLRRRMYGMTLHHDPDDIVCVRSGAAKVGSWPVLNYLRKHGVCMHDPYEYMAAAHGQTALLRQINTLQCNKTRLHTVRLVSIVYDVPAVMKEFKPKDKSLLINVAAVHGRVSILNILGSIDHLSTALNAAEGGSVGVLSWMLEKGFLPNQNINLSFLTAKASKYGHKNVLKWLDETLNAPLSKDLIYVAGRNKRIETAKWLAHRLRVNEE